MFKIFLLVALFATFALFARTARAQSIQTIYLQVTNVATNGMTFTLTNNNFGITDTWRTNVTSDRQIQTTNNVGFTMSNLLAKLRTQWSGQMFFFQSNATSFAIQGAINSVISINFSNGYLTQLSSSGPLTTNGDINVDTLYANRIVGPATAQFGGGFGIATNAIPIHDGVGTNTYIVNPLHVINPTYLFPLRTVTIAGSPDDCQNGTYVLDPSRGVLTNQCTNIFIPFYPNGGPPGQINLSNYVFLQGYAVVSNAVTHPSANGTYVYWTNNMGGPGGFAWTNTVTHTISQFGGENNWDVFPAGSATSLYFPVDILPNFPLTDFPYDLNAFTPPSTITPDGAVVRFYYQDVTSTTPPPVPPGYNMANGINWMLFTPTNIPNEDAFFSSPVQTNAVPPKILVFDHTTGAVCIENPDGTDKVCGYSAFGNNPGGGSLILPPKLP